jgi:two-component system, OmpR family, response regulator CpxR
MARILVVDDDHALCTLIADILSVAKYDVDTAGRVKAALPLFETNYYNLLIADLMLPDGTGIQVAEEAQRRGTPTIILTAYGYRFRKADLARFGLMLKPVRPDELLEAVAEGARTG